MDFKISMRNSSFYIFSIAIIFSSVLYHYTTKSVFDLCEFEKCPYCYGVDLCEEFKQNKITLKVDSLKTFFYNYVSVKNVYLAKFHQESVVLKKLGHNDELNNLDKQVCSETSDSDFSENSNYVINYTDKIVTFLNRAADISDFKICSEEASAIFLQNVLYLGSKANTMDTYIKNIWTILQVNVEPLLIQVNTKNAFILYVSYYI